MIAAGVTKAIGECYADTGGETPMADGRESCLHSHLVTTRTESADLARLVSLPPMRAHPETPGLEEGSFPDYDWLAALPDGASKQPEESWRRSSSLMSLTQEQVIWKLSLEPRSFWSCLLLQGYMFVLTVLGSSLSAR